MSVKKLHCIMEVLSLSKERVALSTTEQESQTRKLVEHFSKNQLDWDKTFHFDVPMSSVAAALNG